MSNSHLRLTFATFALAACLVVSSAPADAEITVLASSAPALKKGMSLPDAASITVPSEKSVRLLLPDGRTRTITGPFSGQVWDSETGRPVTQGSLPNVRSAVSSTAKGGATQSRAGTIQAPAPGAKTQPNKGAPKSF